MHQSEPPVAAALQRITARRPRKLTAAQHSYIARAVRLRRVLTDKHLARRLNVSEATITNAIERLRNLGVMT
jgi:Mn-dependent DtxR family transcriptional regulator